MLKSILVFLYYKSPPSSLQLAEVMKGDFFLTISFNLVDGPYDKHLVFVTGEFGLEILQHRVRELGDLGPMRDPTENTEDTDTKQNKKRQ